MKYSVSSTIISTERLSTTLFTEMNIHFGKHVEEREKRPQKDSETKTMHERDHRVASCSVPCLLSTSINEVNAVPPTVHSSTGAAKFPTWQIHGICRKTYQLIAETNKEIQRRKYLFEV